MATDVAKVKKLIDGRVSFLDASDVEIATFYELSQVRPMRDAQGLQIVSSSTGAVVVLYPSKLTHYILDPAPQVAYTGTLSEWLYLLTSVFFPVRHKIGVGDEILDDSNIMGGGGSIKDALNAINSGSAIGTFTGLVAFNGEITPTISANTNNFNPSGLSSANVISFTITGNRNLTGIQAPSPATNQVIFCHIASGGQLQLVSASPLSLAANRFDMKGNKTFKNKESFILVYSTTVSRWRLYAIYK